MATTNILRLLELKSFWNMRLLPVISGAQYYLGPALILAKQLKASDRIYGWRHTVPPRGLSIILQPDRSA
jgi:hypothetical protein